MGSIRSSPELSERRFHRAGAYDKLGNYLGERDKEWQTRRTTYSIWPPRQA